MSFAVPRNHYRPQQCPTTSPPSMRPFPPPPQKARFPIPQLSHRYQRPLGNSLPSKPASSPKSYRGGRVTSFSPTAVRHHPSSHVLRHDLTTQIAFRAVYARHMKMHRDKWLLLPPGVINTAIAALKQESPRLFAYFEDDWYLVWGLYKRHSQRWRQNPPEKVCVTRLARCVAGTDKFRKRWRGRGRRRCGRR